MINNRVTIKCKDCGNTFSITEEEQNWYKERGLKQPKRCRKCRQARRDKDVSKGRKE